MVRVASDSGRVEAATEVELRRWLYENRRTDGLPVILPTPELVDEMLTVGAFAGLEPDIVLGVIGPLMGQATVEKIAANAVMAGCLPEYFPVVVAGVRALCDPRMDITEVQATTHDLAPLLLVNGPVAREIRLSGSYGALGYGHQANLTIGRALRLCLINIGGGWPGLSDMAVLGHPGKLSYCLAENEEESPLEPLHVSLGYDAEQSVATAVCVGAPHSVLCLADADDPQQHERLLELLARSIAAVGNNNSFAGRGQVVACLNPDHADMLARAGMSRRDIQAELWRRAVNQPDVAEWLFKGASLTETAPVDGDGRRHAFASPDAVLVFVAGGRGVYSAVMPSWAHAPHSEAFVSAEIVTTESCGL